MTEKSLPRQVECGRKETRPDGATNTPEPLDIDDLAKGDRAMPNSGVYGDSTSPVNPKQQSTWFPIWELASRLVRKAGA
jgi:hypothetical protein